MTLSAFALSARSLTGTSAANLDMQPGSAPPLRPESHKEWQAKVQAARQADAKGEPLATGSTHCLPDGMPGMMGAVFPMEILQSRGQVTIIEEAYTQVRRIHFERPQKAVVMSSLAFTAIQ